MPKLEIGVYKFRELIKREKDVLGGGYLDFIGRANILL